MQQLAGAVQIDGELHGGLSGQIGLGGSLSITSTVPPYDGPYEVTPGAEAQTLETANKRCGENIVVKPIPSNYGLVTWNGSYLVIS